MSPSDFSSPGLADRDPRVRTEGHSHHVAGQQGEECMDDISPSKGLRAWKRNGWMFPIIRALCISIRVHTDTAPLFCY